MGRLDCCHLHIPHTIVSHTHTHTHTHTYTHTHTHTYIHTHTLNACITSGGLVEKRGESDKSTASAGKKRHEVVCNHIRRVVTSNKDIGLP